MNRNRELKTVSKILTLNTSALTIGGQVPSSMKRWVTFLMIDSVGISKVSDVGVYLASVGVSAPSKTSLIAAGNRRVFLPIEGTQLSISDKYHPVMMPQSGPDPDTPLFSIAGGKWLGGFASATTAQVFMQYFDE